MGGWLVLERYIAPYLFAVTDCHIKGDFCWYPGQLSAPPPSQKNPEYKLCEQNVAASKQLCKPIRSIPEVGGEPDYPVDEYTLGSAFLNAHREDATTGTFRNRIGLDLAEKWLNYHFDNFITESDIQALANVGLTHMRVPLPHWILGNVKEDEPWIVGKRWEAFLRLCGWARKYKLQIWPDIHTSPGSQNGFDNSGHALAAVTCWGWADNAEHVQRSLQVIDEITNAIAKEGATDVVTGFGLLNEPFKDCNRYVYEQYIDKALDIARNNLGSDTAIYVSDLFLANTFNNGRWWQDASKYNNTYLDSHYYHVFDENPRNLSPRQHIAFTCQHDWNDATSCCYQDVRKPWHMPWQPTNTKPSAGVQRIVSEWSGAYDTLVGAELKVLMKGIAANGTVPKLHKVFTVPEINFLSLFVQAQMVAYESVETGTSIGWFFWTLKMEGSAFAEWDFLRGVREGWIPVLPSSDEPSEDLYGTCYDILFKTRDEREEVIHTFPDPADLPDDRWHGVPIDDDVVLSHGQTLMMPDGIHHRQRYPDNDTNINIGPRHLLVWILFGTLVIAILHFVRNIWHRRRKQAIYTPIRHEVSLVEV